MQLLWCLAFQHPHFVLQESEVTKADDAEWPEPDRDGQQNLEIKIGKGNNIRPAVLIRDHSRMGC